MARRLSLVLALAVLAAVPGTAHAGWFPGETIDGPGGDVVALGDVDLARDGTGAAVYLKRVDGVEHVFVSRFVNGAFAAPERVDAGLAAPGSQPVVAAVDRGRLAIAFVSGGTVYATFRPEGAQGFTAPAAIGAGADPSIAMSIHGVTYLAFTQGGGDVRVARADRGSTALGLLPEPADVDPARTAGAGTGAPKMVVAADGMGLVLFGEQVGGRLHLVGRRVFERRLSVAPQTVSLDGGSVEGFDVDIEDDSSYAWVVFRQGGRAFARRLVGSLFEPPVEVDGGSAAGAPRIDLTGRGEGITAVTRPGNQVWSASLRFDAFSSPFGVGGGGGVDPAPATGVGENGDGLIAWRQPDGVRGRYLDDPNRGPRVPVSVGPEAALSSAEHGPVDTDAGFDVAADRAGNALAVFVQGQGAGRRLVAGLYDREPLRFLGYTTEKYRNQSRPRLRWADASDLWGPLTYRVEVGGQPVGQTTATELIPAAPLPDGVHRWVVVATDRRGQVSTSRPRWLRVDATAPQLKVRLSGSRRARATLKLRVTAADVLNPSGSGLRRVLVDFGDGRRVARAARAAKRSKRGRRAARTRTAQKRVAGTFAHAYRRGGTFRLRVTALDAAGNTAVYERRLKIANK